MLLSCRYRHSLFFALLFLSCTCSAQLATSSLDIKLRSGFIIPHHGYMAYFITENVQAIQVNYGIKTNGSKFWHTAYNFPTVGLGVHYSGLGNDTLYGSLTGLYFFIDREFLHHDKRFNVGHSLSVGIGIASKWHDRQANRENMVLGTPVNVFLQYDLAASYIVFSNHKLLVSIGVAHASNGSVREPNLGFNICTISGGYSYLFSTKEKKTSEPKDDKTPYATWSFGVFGSVKAINAFSQKQYGIFGFTAEKLCRIAPLAMLGVELSAYTDSSIPDILIKYNMNRSNQVCYQKLAVTLNPNYLMGFGKLSLAFQPGVYLKNSYYGFGAISNKLGIRYNVRRGVAISAAIKAHWLAQADFIEVGLKYSFNRNEK